MDQTQVLEVGRPIRSNDQKLETELREILASFNTSRRNAIRNLLDLHGQNSTLFALAAARVLTDPSSDNSTGSFYLAGLIGRTDAVLDLLLDLDLLNDEQARSLAASIGRVDQLLDIRLMRKMIGVAGNDVASVPAAVASRALRVVDAISDCSRLTTFLMRLTHHPSHYVRSKAALLSGRGNINLSRVESFLNSEDSRVRANAIESLWGQKSADARNLFEQASNDPDRRVAINGLVGLCKAGGVEASPRLINLLQSDDPISRRGAAWAMGQVGDPEFAEPLDRVMNDSDQGLRAMAQRSRAMLREPKPVTIRPEVVY